MAWDAESLSKSYQWQAKDAERYLGTLKEKIKHNKSYERIYDEHLARFWVYNHLHGRTFLGSKDALLRELEAMRSTPQTVPNGSYDPDRFKRFFDTCLEKVIQDVTAMAAN
jgi:hypothetical protein